VDGETAYLNPRTLKEDAGILGAKGGAYLLVEGTRLGSPGKTYTESQVKANLHDLLSQHPGAPIVVDFAPHNLEHLLSALEVVEALERHLVVTPKDAYLLWGLSEADPLWGLVPSRVLKEGKAGRESRKKVVWKEVEL